jgi:hypothetical protein
MLDLKQALLHHSRSRCSRCKGLMLPATCASAMKDADHRQRMMHTGTRMQTAPDIVAMRHAGAPRVRRAELSRAELRCDVIWGYQTLSRPACSGLSMGLRKPVEVVVVVVHVNRAAGHH